MNESKLAEELGLTEEEVGEMGLASSDIMEETDNAEGEHPLYFIVPDSTPQHILGKKAWSVGDRVELDRDIFD